MSLVFAWVTSWIEVSPNICVVVVIVCLRASKQQLAALPGLWLCWLSWLSSIRKPVSSKLRACLAMCHWFTSVFFIIIQPHMSSLGFFWVCWFWSSRYRGYFRSSVAMVAETETPLRPKTAKVLVATRFTAVFSWRIKATRTWFSCLVDGVTIIHIFSEKHSGKHSNHDCECEENLHVDVLVSKSILQSKDWLINKLCSFI